VTINVVDPYKPTSVTLNRTGIIKMTVGDPPLTLTPSLSPATARTELKWDSSKPQFASVVDGVVKALAKGRTDITVKTANGKSAKVTVDVEEVKVTLVPSKSTTLFVSNGDFELLELDVRPNLIETQSGISYDWSPKGSAYVEMVTGKSCLVRPKWYGTAPNKTATVKITVNVIKQLSDGRKVVMGTASIDITVKP